MIRAAFTLAVVCMFATTARAQAPSPAFTAEFTAGTDAYRLGNYPEARAHLERARALEPGLPGPHRFLAAVDAAEGKWQDCIASARTAILANPLSTEIAATRKLHDDCRASLGLPSYGGDYADGGAIAVSANVAGAAVTVAGLRSGSTPLAPRPIALGDVEVSATKSGWKTATATVTIIPGVVTDVQLVLEEEAPALAIGGTPAIPDRGWLIVTIPAGAALAIDGGGATPDDRGRYPLPPGDHTVDVSKPGSIAVSRTVRVSRGQEQTLAIELMSLSGVAQRRRLGTIALGAAVGLGAAGAITALLAMRTADEARDWAEIERTRPTVPLDESTPFAPVHTRAQIEARGDRATTLAIASGVSYGLAAAALGAGLYLYARAPGETRVELAPVMDDGWGVAVRGVLPCIARALAAALAVSLGACTWFDAGPPDRACRIDRDCFRAQGEVCDPSTHTCAQRLDGGTLDATVTGAPP